MPEHEEPPAVHPIHVGEVTRFPVAQLRLGGEETQIDRTLAKAVVEALEG